MSRNLNDEGGLSEREEPQARWQKHVLVAIWILLCLLVVVVAGVFYAEAHGFFQPSTASSASSWPDCLPQLLVK